MQILSSTSGGIQIDWASEQRDGHCPDCNCLLEPPTSEDKKEWRETGRLLRFCPDCGERKLGKLICRMFKLSSPEYPQCNCVGKYLWWMLRYFLVVEYNKRRVAYVGSHRDNHIPEYYRTGEPLPDSFGSAIWELVKIQTRR